MQDISSVILRYARAYLGLAKLVIDLAGGDWSKVDLIIRNRKDAKELVNEMNHALEDFRNATSAGKFFSYMDGLETFFEDLPDDITIKYEHSIADFVADMRDRRADEIENGWREDDGIVAALDAMFDLPKFDPDLWLKRKFLCRGARISSEANVPTNVRRRFEEAYACYIYGNHLAAVAMARAVLEFVLVQRYNLNPKTLLGDILNKNWSMIHGLKNNKELQQKANHINELAKESVHVIENRDRRVSNILTDLNVLGALNDLREIIEFIYE